MLPRETIIMMKLGMPETEKWNKNGFHTHWFHNFFSHFSMIFKNPWTDPKSVKKLIFFRLNLNQPLLSSWNKVWCDVSEYFYCWQFTFNHVRNNNMDFNVVVTIIAVRFNFFYFLPLNISTIMYLPTFCNLWGRYYTYLHMYIYS